MYGAGRWIPDLRLWRREQRCLGPKANSILSFQLVRHMSVYTISKPDVRRLWQERSHRNGRGGEKCVREFHLLAKPETIAIMTCPRIPGNMYTPLSVGETSFTAWK